jgi:monoamine oxidase
VSYDVIVIGAGAAGLAALADLDRAGLRILCLEARDRTGGRIHTIHAPHTPVPIELGAEFIHGCPRESFDIVRVAGLRTIETGGRMLHVIGGKVINRGEGGRLLDDLKTSASPDRDETFASFLDRSLYDRDEKQAATGFVEGFNAARKEEVSVASLAKDMKAGDAIDGDRAFRIQEGYGALVHALESARSEVRLNAAVESIQWKAGACTVRLHSGEAFTAGRVLVTVPLGVLQSGDLRFDPEPREILDAARALRFGVAVRITLRFQRAFWEDLPAFRDAGFILSAELVFPTWWTTLPVRAPVLTGWSAGPKADPLLHLTQAEIAERALGSLRNILGIEPPPVEGWWMHDWHADPFARGAYSYVPAGALPAREALARPVADTLFFAGEAIDLIGYGGTVHGAIASGRRAARQILDQTQAG